MKDKFDFLRKIFSSENPDLLLKAYKSLSNEGLEVYIEVSPGDFLIFREELISDSNELYVPAADWAFSKEILTKQGLSEYITEYVVPESIQAEIDKTEEILLKKRKTVYIETLVVFVLFVIYIIFTMVTH
ncbi:hypothetical protein [Pseudobutyrivibrio sp.]|uniref:hypothetical protein n=1 Tax=Pseudobutyrivibrio sp. TaxID=2014367 RepID=UPI001B287361|nr:hypothetical protein [Pseudobutyrivibrio sp.]MBO5617283.1 hypothetical protein [Pseudobutyrivibrio sp.]MBP3263269.1 hypothetical protein [Pseudobutyrivibrio sp.]